MGRIGKIIALVLAALFVLVVVTVLLVALFFDPNDYKDRIEAAVESETGRSFEIAGDLELRLFPWLRVTSGEMRLGDAEGFDAEHFARIEGMAASLRLLPLLQRRVEIGTVRLVGLDLNLAVDADGRTNWDDLVDADDDAPPPEPVEPGDGFDLRDLSIGGVEVRNANVRYSDARDGQRYTLDDFDLTLDAVRMGEPVPLQFSARFTQALPEMAGEVDGRMRLTLDLADGRVQVARLRVDLGIEGGAAAPLRALDGRLEIDDIVAGLAGGAVRVSGLHLDGRARADDLPADGVTADVRIDRVDFDGDAGTVAVQALRVAALDLTLEADLEGEGLGNTPRLSGRFVVPDFSARGLLDAFEVDYTPADEGVLRRVGAEGRFALAGEDLRLDDFMLRLDDTRLDGMAGRVNGRIVFDLDVDDIDLDRYLPPADDEAPEDEGSGDLDAVEIPSELLRDLDAEGEFRVGRVRLADLEFTDLVVAVRAENGDVRLNPLGASLYEGRYIGDIRLDARGDTPRLALDERVEGVQLNPLMLAMFEVEQLTGRIDGRFSLGATGHTLGEMRTTLNGDMAVSLDDAAWTGVDIWHQIRAARAQLQGRSAPQRSDPPRTEITELQATATVRDGIVRSEEFLALLPFLRMTGTGEINLVSAELDYRLDAQFLDRPELARDELMGELRGRTLPLRIDGALASPRVRPDFGAMVTGEIRDRASDVVRDVGERLGITRRRDRDEPPPEDEDGDEAEAEAEEERPSTEDRVRRLLDRIGGGGG